MAVSEKENPGPRQFDLDRCVHCGLCLNACPTYRDLGLEMDSPRGRIFQMAQVAAGAPITDSYKEHIGLCLACRGCESACPSGVPYGRMVEDARAQIEAHVQRGPVARRLHRFVFERLLPSPRMLSAAGTALYLYEASGLKLLTRGLGMMHLLGRLGDLGGVGPIRRTALLLPSDWARVSGGGKAALFGSVRGGLHRQCGVRAAQ